MNHETARARFETFAGMGEGELPPDPIDALQVRLHRWQIAKFGLQPMERMVLGVVEEMGELAEAMSAIDHAGIDDAVGDVTVYVTQLFTLNQMAIGTVFDVVAPWAGVFAADPSPIKAAGDLAHVTLKRLQGIRGFGIDSIWHKHLFGAVCRVLWLAEDMTGRKPRRSLATVAEHVMARTGDMLPKVAS